MKPRPVSLLPDSPQHAEIDTLRDALAELDDQGQELAALIHATHQAPGAVPGLLAWLEHVADREQHRRQGLDFPLQPPEAAIPPEEDAVSIAAAGTPRTLFAQGDATVRMPAAPALA